MQNRKIDHGRTLFLKKPRKITPASGTSISPRSTTGCGSWGWAVQAAAGPIPAPARACCPETWQIAAPGLSEPIFRPIRSTRPSPCPRISPTSPTGSARPEHLRLLRPPGALHRHPSGVYRVLPSGLRTPRVPADPVGSRFDPPRFTSPAPSSMQSLPLYDKNAPIFWMGAFSIRVIQQRPGALCVPKDASNALAVSGVGEERQHPAVERRRVSVHKEGVAGGNLLRFQSAGPVRRKSKPERPASAWGDPQ